jgi:hypothetical protein
MIKQRTCWLPLGRQHGSPKPLDPERTESDGSDIGDRERQRGHDYDRNGGAQYDRCDISN